MSFRIYVLVGTVFKDHMRIIKYKLLTLLVDFSEGHTLMLGSK